MVVEKGGVHPCIVCKTSLDQFLQSRPLPRSHALQYGLSEDQVTPGARVCNTCRCKSVRSRYTQCPMPKCPNGKGRVKRLRSLPGKWTELPPEIRNPIIIEFQIPETLTKCCSACFNRISRRLAPHIQDGNAIADDDQLSQCQQLRWSEEEIESAKRALKEFGTNWSKVAERVGNTKTHHQCKNFYFNYRKKMGLDLLVQEYNKNHLGEERKPTVTDEEESGSSTSSCDEMSGVPLNSDTDSAASPNNSQPIEEKRSSPMKTVLVSDVREEQLDLAKVRQATETEETKAPNPPTQTAVCKEDYDSSATETADEGQGGADADASAVVRQSPKTINYPISSTSVTVVPSQPECGGVQTPGVLGLRASDLGVLGLSIHAVNGPVREGSPPTRSVKDLVLGMIEMQLLKNPGGHGNNTSVNLSGTIVEPTISSILKTDHHAEIHRSDITFGREYRSEAKSRQVQVTQDTSLATLSVVNSHHSSTPTSLHPHLPPPGSSLLERIPQCMQATITQCSTPSSVEFPKEGLVVVQVQQALRENEGVTLDLSIKKPRECSPSPLASIVRDSSPMGSRGDSPYQPIHQHHHHESPSLPPHTTLHTIPPPAHSKTVPSIHHPPSQPSVTLYRTSGVSGETGYYSHPVVLPPEQVHNVSKSQSVFPSETRGSSGPTPHLVMNQLQTQSRVGTSTKMLKPAGHSVKVSPKLTHVAAKGGSITHGTPVSTAPLMVPSHLPPFMLQHPPRFEGLLRQMTPPQQTPSHGKDGTPLSGSITQGTPMHHVPHHLSSDKRVERTLIPIPGAVHDYYKRLSPAAPNVGNNPSNVVSGAYSPYPRDGSSTQTTSASGVFTSPYPHQASRPAGYATQQQLSSRQIIMNDYITSQQMDVSRRGSLGLGSNAPLDKTTSQQDSPSPRIVSSSPHYYPPSSAPSVYCRSSPANSNIMEQSQTPPHHTHTPPTRQGVIQRHNTNPCVQSRPPSSGNTKPPSPAASPHQRLHFLPHHPPTHHPHHHFPPLYPPPPGHEAFSSLVDVAVQQPSLPVPQKDSEKRQSTHHMHHHEGLGKSMADSLSNVRLLAEHQHQERDNRERELSNSGTPRGQGSSSRVAPGGDSSTLTAASLIDAIITHQINQSSTDSSVPGASSGGNSGSLPTRPGDRLFQGVHRDQPPPSSAHQSAGLHIPESNGKTSPLKSSHSPNVVHLDHEQQPTQQESSAPGNNTKVITLAEHIDSIITKDFNINPPTSAVSAHIAPHHRNMAQIYPHHPYHLLPPLPPTSTVAAEIMAEHQSWKLRKALQQQAKEMEVAREREKSSTAPGNALQSDERQIIRVAQPQSPRTKTSSGSYHMEPLSPSEHVASGHHWLPGGSVGSAGPSESMSFLPSRGRYSSEQTKDKPSHLSPLDYVKNRIVEVMRTSEEEKSEQAMTNQKQQPRANNTNNIQISQQSKTLGSGQSQQSSVPASNSQSDVSSRPVEPAPLLSAQYEPLSDED
uniref:Nuclear receptor corepressor 1 n=1 Tax=Timema monikensis TaxID=170555 RepID=A0A7R9HRC8_9NEOP|nr:unnamed protein product [Timema monikensis]